MNICSASRVRVLASFIVAVSFLTVPHSRAIDLSISPTTIEWTSNLWVDVAISNINIGGEVILSLFVDLNNDGIADPGDQLITAFDLEDGGTNNFGAEIIADDKDGLANGSIHTRISYHGSSYSLIAKGIGSYVWAAKDEALVTNDYAAFQITQTPTPTWVSGNVRDFVPPSNNVAGAYVILGYYFDHTGPMPATWSDTNGNFQIYVPSGVSSDEVAGVFALGLGYVSSDEGPDGEPFSFHGFTNALSTGNNAIPEPLFVASAAPGMVATVSGTVYDPDGFEASGVLVELEMDEEDGGDLMSIVVTDENGDYSTPYPQEEGVVFAYCGGALLNMRGYVGDAKSISVTSDVSGVDLYMSNLTVLARNRVVMKDTGTGVVGVDVEFDSDRSYGATHTFDNGVYEVCLLAETNADAELDDETLASMGYITTSEYIGVTLAEGTVYTDALFVVESGRILSGSIYDKNTNAIGGGEIQVFVSNAWNWAGASDVTPGGTYEVLLGPGSYRAQAVGFDGFISQVYSNHYTWEWDEGPVYDPVVITTENVGGIDFYLEEASEISGTVLAGGSPLEYADITAFVREWNPEGWWQLQFAGSTFTETDGTYRIEVSAGTNYAVECRSPQGTFWIGQFYDGVSDQQDATLITTAIGSPATNIDFNLVKGGIITGTVFEADGSTPVPYAWVEARHPVEDTSLFGGSANDMGEYRIAATAGVYIVAVYADNWPHQYYDGWYSHEWTNADHVTVIAEQYTNVTFEMLQPSYVEGQVKGALIGLEGIQVEIWQGDNYRIGQSDSDSNGYFSVQVPAATGCVAWARPGADSTYIDQVWSNTAWSDPTYFDIPETSTVSNIDFNLVEGMRVEGSVTDEGALPMAEVDVGLLYTNGEWAAGGRTDDEGDYYIIAGGGVDYIVQARTELPRLYPTLYYNGTHMQTGATVINPATGDVISNIDFTMAPGYKVEGYVLKADGITPTPDGYVEAEDTESNIYGTVNTDGTGWYENSLPRHRPLYLKANATDHQGEYHQGGLDWGQASQLQPAAFTTSRIDFVLYDWTGDMDGDGIPDYQEDTRPDGVYAFDEDDTSWTNRDTDADGQTDYAEKNLTHTDPEDGTDYLKCDEIQLSPTALRITWRSATGTWYMIQRSDAMERHSWSNWAGVMGTGTYTTVVGSSSRTRHNYRVETQQ